eukprot:gene4347-5542_t
MPSVVPSSAVPSASPTYRPSVYENTLTYITTLAGTGGTTGTTDTAVTSAVLNGPRNVWVDTAGTVLVSDTQANKIRKVFTAGTVQTAAGTGVASTFNSPRQLFGDTSRTTFIADYSNHRVVRMPLGTLIGTLFAGTPGTASSTGDG